MLTVSKCCNVIGLALLHGVSVDSGSMAERPTQLPPVELVRGALSERESLETSGMSFDELRVDDSAEELGFSCRDSTVVSNFGVSAGRRQRRRRTP